MGTSALIAVQLWPATARAQVDTASTAAGTAVASADLLGVAPVVSGLSLTTTYGESKAAYEGTESEASSATVNLGALGLVLANTTFCGQVDLPEKEQPQPLTADSEDGAAATTNGTGDLIGEQVSVDPDPLAASATNTPVNLTLPGILTVEGHSSASVAYTSGSEQEAESSVTENLSLLGGLVQMSGLTWTAKQESGATNQTASSFDLGQIKVAGLPLSPPGTPPASQVAALNAVLSPLGFSLLLPSQSTDSSTNAVSIGPLTLRFSGSSVERNLLSPVATAVTHLEAELAQSSSPGSDCTQFKELIYNLGTNINTLVNVALAIAQGAGSLDLDLGGVSAGTQAPPNFADPFAVGGPETGPSGPTLDSGAAPSGAGTAPTVTGVGGATSSEPGLPSSSGSLSMGASPSSSPTSGSASSFPPAGRSNGGPYVRASVQCQSVSPAHGPSCWRGLGAVAGAGAVAVGSVLFLADYSVSSWRRRLRPVRRSTNHE